MTYFDYTTCSTCGFQIPAYASCPDCDGLTPSREQQDIIDVVAALTNLLMKDISKRGSGQSTLRSMIARRIINDDTGNKK